jgi:hypothetical protein
LVIEHCIFTFLERGGIVGESEAIPTASRFRSKMVLILLPLALTLVAAACAADSEGSSSGGDTFATTSIAAQTTTSTSQTTASAPQVTTATAGETIAYKLAVIDGVSSVSPGDSTVTTYQGALDRAGKSCPNDTEQRLADMAVVASQILANDYGKSVSTLEMLGAVSESLAGTGLEPSDCAETFAALVVLMGGG